MASRFNFRVWNPDEKGGMFKMCPLTINNDFGYQHYWKVASSYDCVVMQSTGLEDKNGKEIFEGDILSIDDYEKGPNFSKVEIVKWMDSDDCIGDEDWIGFSFRRNKRVVGNIYENPKLLKE